MADRLYVRGVKPIFPEESPELEGWTVFPDIPLLCCNLLWSGEVSCQDVETN